nr:GNAT family N-acetyltransferase [uncultured Butyrivibrio sp.]
MLEYHSTTEEEKRLISNWKYDGEYAIYNTLSYSEQIKAHRGFANPSNNYFSFYDDGKLIGYVNFVNAETEVRFGIGVKPECCNRGYGQEICKMAITLSNQLFVGKPLCLEVRTWNTRAVRCYEKAGFHVIGNPVRKTTPIGEGDFFRMTVK